MDPRNRRALLFVVLGVALLANPVYLYPEDVSYETTYTYEASPVEYVPRTEATTFHLKSCGWNPLQSAECATIETMARGERVELRLDPNRGVDDELWSFDYVRTGGEYYEPNATLDGETLTLSLDPVAIETVKDDVADDVDETPGFVRRAVRTGRVTVTDAEVYESRRFYVERGGTYYLVEPTASERRPTGWGWKAPSDTALDAMRLGAWIAGIALIWRAGEWSERGRRATERENRAEMRDERLR